MGHPNSFDLFSKCSLSFRFLPIATKRFALLPGFVPVAEAIFFREKDPKKVALFETHHATRRPVRPDDRWRTQAIDEGEPTRGVYSELCRRAQTRPADLFRRPPQGPGGRRRNTIRSIRKNCEENSTLNVSAE